MLLINASNLTITAIETEDLVVLDSFENTAKSYYEFFKYLYIAFDELK